MNNVSAPAIDGQAPARRFGSCVALIVGLFACVCTVGIWYFFAREGINSLVDSIYLQANGVTTRGTVASVEEFSDGDASFPSSSYKLTVSFEVDGIIYSVTGSAYYKPIGRSWVGEPMPIIYDPEDPDTALIDNFQERWLEPIIKSAP